MVSGGIDGRPVAPYIASNTGERRSSPRSASSLIRRIGCSLGTRYSGPIGESIDACRASHPPRERAILCRQSNQVDRR